MATAVFSQRPLLIDELAQLWQAQRYAEWRLSIPAPLHREFFSFLHLVDTGDAVYAQFPPGGPFMLWLGVLAGAPRMVGPVCGALCVWLFARIARAAEPEAGDGWVVGATLLCGNAVCRVHVRFVHESRHCAVVDHGGSSFAHQAHRIGWCYCLSAHERGDNTNCHGFRGEFPVAVIRVYP